MLVPNRTKYEWIFKSRKIPVLNSISHFFRCVTHTPNYPSVFYTSVVRTINSDELSGIMNGAFGGIIQIFTLLNLAIVLKLEVCNRYWGMDCLREFS